MMNRTLRINWDIKIGVNRLRLQSDIEMAYEVLSGQDPVRRTRDGGWSIRMTVIIGKER